MNYLSVISSKFIQIFAQMFQYFTLIDQSIALITVTSLVYLVSGKVIISVRRLFTETMMVLATSTPKISDFRFCNFNLI